MSTIRPYTLKQTWIQTICGLFVDTRLKWLLRQGKFPVIDEDKKGLIKFILAPSCHEGSHFRFMELLFCFWVLEKIKLFVTRHWLSCSQNWGCLSQSCVNNQLMFCSQCAVIFKKLFVTKILIDLIIKLRLLIVVYVNNQSIFCP